MSLLLFVCLVQVVSVMAQSTLLDSQCDSDCYMMKVQIQMLTEMMGNVKDANDKLAQTVMELMDKNDALSDKNDMLENKVNKLDQDLANQKLITSQLQAEISELKLKNPTPTKIETTATTIVTTPAVIESTTANVFESSTSEDCEDIRSLGHDVSGVYGVNGGNGEIKHIYCEMTSDSGTWTRILHRQDNLTDFTYKKWAEYEAGFGDPHGSHWMGLVQMNKLTTNKAYKLRVDLEDWEGETRFAEYTTFSVGPASDKYRLSIIGYSGSAGDSMHYHNNRMFTTIDQNNDQAPNRVHDNCAQPDGTGRYTGGWWHHYCFMARLTGTYLEPPVLPSRGIQWPAWKGHAYSYKVATMKVERL